MKVQEIKKYFVLFYMFGFLAGILSANFIAGEYLADLGIFHEFFMEQYMQTPIDNSEYFWYLLRLRITPLVILGLAGCTKFRKAAVLLFLMWTGLLSGLILTVAVMHRGFGGILLCLVGVLPQLPLYTAGYLIYTLDGKEIGRSELVFDENVEKAGYGFCVKKAWKVYSM